MLNSRRGIGRLVVGSRGFDHAKQVAAGLVGGQRPPLGGRKHNAARQSVYQSFQSRRLGSQLGLRRGQLLLQRQHLGRRGRLVRPRSRYCITRHYN